jgi:hypothetical protein
VLLAGMGLEEDHATLVAAALVAAALRHAPGLIDSASLGARVRKLDVADGFKGCKLETVDVYGCKQDSDMLRDLGLVAPLSESRMA